MHWMMRFTMELYRQENGAQAVTKVRVGSCLARNVAAGRASAIAFFKAHGPRGRADGVRLVTEGGRVIFDWSAEQGET